MKILVPGAPGQLSIELVRQNKDFNFSITALTLDELDITSPAQLEQARAQYTPDLIINAAAYNDVDGAESEPELAIAVNQTGPANLSEICKKYNLPLFHVSTDFVFDGTKGSSYIESDPVNPLGVYAASKAAGEREVRRTLAHHIIVRTSWLYSPFSHNFVRTMIRLMMEKETLKVIADQHGSPTSAGDLARALLVIAQQYQTKEPLEWGTYHYSGAGTTSWHGFAEKILQILKTIQTVKTGRIDAIQSSEYAARAKRPQYSVLDCTKIETAFGIRARLWAESLDPTVHEIMEEMFPDGNC